MQGENPRQRSNASLVAESLFSGIINIDSKTVWAIDLLITQFVAYRRTAEWILGHDLPAHVQARSITASTNA